MSKSIDDIAREQEDWIDETARAIIGGMMASSEEPCDPDSMAFAAYEQAAAMWREKQSRRAAP